MARELYDHAGDTGLAPAAFDDFENENLAGRPAYAHVQAALLARLRAEVEKWMTPNPPPMVEEAVGDEETREVA